VINHHHAGFGNINTNLYNRGGNQNLSFTTSKGLDHRLLLRTWQASMQKAHLEIREHLMLQLTVHVDGRPQVHFL